MPKDYYYDFEFIEAIVPCGLFGRKKKKILQPISIGVVGRDGSEYYALFNDFDVDAAWGAHNLVQVSGDARNRYPEGVREYWLRDNVLQPIFFQEHQKIAHLENLHGISRDFTLANMKRIVKLQGKSQKQVAEELLRYFFPRAYEGLFDDFGITRRQFLEMDKGEETVRLKGYYSAYDHVLFCSLFGRMVDLPKGLPWYTYDLKQELDNLAAALRRPDGKFNYYSLARVFSVDKLSDIHGYPRNNNEHDALSDARFNRDLDLFLNEFRAISRMAALRYLTPYGHY